MPNPETTRAVTWNIGAARRSSIEEVETQLREINADIIVLQELDVGVNRTGGVDQPRLLAEALGMEFTFAAALDWDGGVFGLSVLARIPFRSVRRISLDNAEEYEPRIALDVTLCRGDRPLRIVDVHADFIAAANEANLRDLGEALGSLANTDTLVAGDFNRPPDGKTVSGFIETTQTIDIMAAHDALPTRNGRRIDLVLAPEQLTTAVSSARTLSTTASDHSPVVVEF